MYIHNPTLPPPLYFLCFLRSSASAAGLDDDGLREVDRGCALLLLLLQQLLWWRQHYILTCQCAFILTESYKVMSMIKELLYFF